MKLQYRQGDVLLIAMDELPSDAVLQENQGRIVLAYGEVTGHAHAISTEYADAFVSGEQMLLLVDEGANLVHEEHGPIRIKKGIYRVVRQREYDPSFERMVAD